MTAGAWNLSKNAKLNLGNAIFNLGGAAFNITLHSIGASANLVSGTVSVFTEIGSECTGGGYTAVGTALASPTWALSGQNAKFDAANWVVTGAITSIKYAVIMQSVSATSGIILCHSTLSATPFDVTGTNTLTIEMNSAGIFTLA